MALKDVTTNNLLISFALKEEGQGLFEKEGLRVIYTGVGKINATYKLTQAIYEKRPSLVINFGTAGSRNWPAQTLIECNRFIQRDMNLSAMGLPVGITPFEKNGGMLEVPQRLPALTLGVCSSGDNIEIGPMTLDCDALDMEAYALAKVCQKEDLDFLCVKFITDGSDASVKQDWKNHVKAAGPAFYTLFESILKKTT